eukprot:COSAG02_NODE_32839_length_509_cov_1.641463_1_plen_130_part_01
MQEWSDEDGLTLYVFKSLYDAPKVWEGERSDDELELASIIHWEDATATNKKHGRTFLEPPSEYVEITDDTQNALHGQTPTRRSVVILHRGHLTAEGSRYEATRRALGNYAVINVNKPAAELGIRRALVDR